MQIQSCMTKKVDLANPQMTLAQVAQKMRDGDYGFMPVGENDRLVGIVTDRDLAIRGTAKGSDPNKTKLQEVMSKIVHYCFEKQNLEEVLKTMSQNKVRRMPVLNDQKRLVGVVSLTDFTHANLAQEQKNQVEETLSEISKPQTVHPLSQVLA